MSRVSGEQESYRAEMLGLYLISQLADPGQVAKLDNQAVTKVARVLREKKESDVDLGVPLAETVQQKGLQVEWIKGHRTEQEAANAADKQDIHYNNVTDGMAKPAATLALQDIVHNSPASIHIAGAEAPTPARKWILKMRRQHEVTGVHWVTWKPLKGIRRHLWTQWLWGNIAWMGCGYPGERTKVSCTLCGKKHPGPVQARLVQCQVWKEHFRAEFCSAWGDWEQYVQKWWDTAPEEDLDHASKLRIPTTLASTIPANERVMWRGKVAEFQHTILITAQQLRGSLPMPPTELSSQGPQKDKRTQSDSLWGTALRRRVVKPKVNDHKLWTHCAYRVPDTTPKRGPLRKEGAEQFACGQNATHALDKTRRRNTHQAMLGFTDGLAHERARHDGTCSRGGRCPTNVVSGCTCL